MKALTVLYGGSLAPEAFEPVFSGKSAFSLALEKARSFPGTEKIALLGLTGTEYPGIPAESSDFILVRSDKWTKKSLLEKISSLGEGFALTFFAWADCPFLDPVLAKALADRHLRYAAEYSYADGWPYGFAPELLSPGTAGILCKILGDDDGGTVERDTLFSVLQKDINAFDIETEISPVDLRRHRLSLSADSARNLLLIKRFFDAGLKGCSEAADLIEKHPGLLRTLPAFYSIQVSGACPQACSLCPWPKASQADKGIPVTERRDFMGKADFGSLLDKIAAFSSDAVIDLSLWGDLSLHPDKMELIQMALAKPGLSLVIETSGLGWKASELEELARVAANAPSRKTPALPGAALSWIVSLDASDPERYKEVRGPGYAEAVDCAKKLLDLFPGNAYVQAVRVKGFEDDIEKFYRYWKEAVPGKGQSHVIIQKYDDFCGALPKLQASDLSPVKRLPCWHLMRDMAILIDGKVPVCKEVSAARGAAEDRSLGNVFDDPLEDIWKKGEALYLEHGASEYPGMCAECDEYYTYNF
ncbi:spiro-SPASM protein [Leadbettera azotonutricia]|uniref:Radical SAM domain protein n=1 Tax=Leadbettera azotonutricia (strain ATCC BAA-888 / DSM 13862 / ZAS-9) TaxID=545695 RepID=F5Y6R1_LEAAZ|nr:spiro-SPASM protein [Leadbettera azotonutricia]AEF82103.1 radical SAM domain protein [Leadbettera azotonutricia ZAS-9]